MILNNEQLADARADREGFEGSFAQLAGGVDEAIVMGSSPDERFGLVLMALSGAQSWTRGRHFGVLADAFIERHKLLAERDEARAEVVRLGRENELLVTALREANGNRAVMIAQHRALISVVRDREAAAMAEGAPGFAAATERLRAALAEERIEGETG